MSLKFKKSDFLIIVIYLSVFISTFMVLPAVLKYVIRADFEQFAFLRLFTFLTNILRLLLLLWILIGFPYLVYSSIKVRNKSILVKWLIYLINLWAMFYTMAKIFVILRWFYPVDLYVYPLY